MPFSFRFAHGAADLSRQAKPEKSNLPTGPNSGVHFNELGESGERAVGEEINKLMRFGCHVVHDLVVENWNIDHVVVAPSGVYLIETKAYRKRKTQGDEFYKVRFDGKALHFPGWTEKCSLRQAQRNAGWLADELSKLLGEVIQVQAVLALPGWMVSRERRGAVTVLNHREFQICVVWKTQEKLSPDRVERIAAILDERCRTVEFWFAEIKARSDALLKGIRLGRQRD